MQGDCLERMKEIESGSVDMILTDPPYGTMKGIEKSGHYGGQKGHDWDETIKHEPMLSECNRVLCPKGCLILFSQEPYTAKLITETHGNLPFSYRLVWLKNHFANALIAKKAPVKYTEDLCVFFKRYEGRIGHPLQEYFLDEFSMCGMTSAEICAELKTTGAAHYFTTGVQFRVPNAKHLKRLQEMTGRFSIKHSVVVDTHKQFISGNPLSVYNLPEGAKYKSNVLEFRKEYRGEHPTQKPVALMADLIKTYTNERGTVLDFTMGSGTTGVACANLNRNFIGIEMDLDYFNIALERIEEAETKAIEAMF